MAFQPVVAVVIPLPVGNTRLDVANPLRQSFILANPGASTILVWPTAQVPANGGIPIAPGGSIFISRTVNGDLATAEWWAQATAATFISAVEILYQS